MASTSKTRSRKARSSETPSDKSESPKGGRARAGIAGAARAAKAAAGGAAAKAASPRRRSRKTTPRAPGVTPPKRGAGPADGGAVETSEPAEPLEAAVARRAYELYLARGEEDGHDVEDWLRAEAEVRGESG